MPVVGCPKCRTPLQIADQMAGQTVACPKCGQHLLIPGPAAPQATGVQSGPPPIQQPRPGGPPPQPRQPEPAQEDAAASASLGGSMMTRMPKPVLFGLLGAIGALLGALLIEVPYQFASPPPATEKPAPKAQDVKVDIMFVLDVTGSMQTQINGVRDGIGDFVNKLQGVKLDETGQTKLDVQVGLTYFRDRSNQPDGPAEDPQPFRFRNGSFFTDDPLEFREQVSRLRADRGGDLPESALDALAIAARLPNRPGALKVLLLITDAPPRLPDREMFSIDQTRDELRRNDVKQIHLIVREARFQFEQLQRDGGVAVMPGKTFSLDAIAAGQRFDDILRGFTADIVSEVRRTIGSLTSGGQYEEKDAPRLIFANGLWTSLVALGLALFLIVGQKLYMRQDPLDLVALGKGSLSLLAGLLGGVLAQSLYLAFSGNAALAFIGQMIGWWFFGAVIGCGMAFFVPNLVWWRGLLGGMLGGFLGLLAYSLFSLLGGVVGRMLGAFILGFAIGVMVALAEVAFRRFWLEVRFGPREVRTVTLGSAAITVGSDEKRATVVVRDAPALAFRYSLEGETVVCEDLASGRSAELEAGESRKVGNVTITVCSPETTKEVGLILELSNGKKVPLSEGLPLTAEDLPGLLAGSPDGTVALVNRKPADPTVLMLRNRSKSPWTIAERSGETKTIDPGLGFQLEPGTRVNFGQVHGELVRKGKDRDGRNRRRDRDRDRDYDDRPRRRRD